MESISKKSGKKFTGKLAEIMLRIGAASPSEGDTKKVESVDKKAVTPDKKAVKKVDKKKVEKAIENKPSVIITEDKSGGELPKKQPGIFKVKVKK